MSPTRHNYDTCPGPTLWAIIHPKNTARCPKTWHKINIYGPPSQLMHTLHDSTGPLVSTSWPPSWPSTRWTTRTASSHPPPPFSFPKSTQYKQRSQPSIIHSLSLLNHPQFRQKFALLLNLVLGCDPTQPETQVLTLVWFGEKTQRFVNHQVRLGPRRTRRPNDAEPHYSSPSNSL